MTVIEFKGVRHEVDAAEAWCGHHIYEGYAIKRADCAYHFSFLCPFEAQRFSDAHSNNAQRFY